LKPNNKFTFSVIIFATLFISATTFHEACLNKVAEVLVYQDPVEQVDAIIVLAGSGTGNRIRAGVRLFKQGLGKVIIFSGGETYPGTHQYMAMKKLVLTLNVPENKIIAGELKGETNTWGEGITNLKTLQENNLKSFILVTSAFHSNRAHSVYKQLISEMGYDFKMLVSPADDPRVPIQEWWKSRTAKKAILIEYLATVNFMFEH